MGAARRLKRIAEMERRAALKRAAAREQGLATSRRPSPGDADLPRLVAAVLARGIRTTDPPFARPEP